MEKTIKITTYNLGRGSYNKDYFKGQRKKEMSLKEMLINR